MFVPVATACISPAIMQAVEYADGNHNIAIGRKFWCQWTCMRGWRDSKYLHENKYPEIWHMSVLQRFMGQFDFRFYCLSGDWNSGLKSDLYVHKCCCTAFMLISQLFNWYIELLLCVCVGEEDVATHGIYSIDDELCDDLEGGGSNGYRTFSN